MKLTLKTNQILLFIVLFLSILPTINLGVYSIPVLYLLIPIGVLIFLFTILGWIKVPKIQKFIMLIFIVIMLEIFLSTLYGTVMALGKFDFPTDIIQYFARLMTIISFITIFYYGKIDADSFIKYFLIILNIGMLIGILQWIPWPGREFFIELYPFRDGSLQLSQLNRQLSDLRLHGIAQMATANGGLATFFFVFGFSIFIFYKKYRFLTVSLMTLSLINIFASQARAGILALVFSMFLFYVVSIYVNKKSFKPTFYFIFIVIASLFIGVYLYKNDNPFIHKMIYRWNVLFETGGGSRIEQVNYFLSLIENPFQFLFGLSKQVINQSLITFGVEIEPVNIFVTYGAIGFLLQYLLVITLLFYFLKNMRNSIANKASIALLAASFIGLFSYQIFSVAYYFFRETRVGLFPWILMGVAIGVYERSKKKREKP